ncbi:acetolactate synthase catalytic subunit [Tsukamurella sp. NPDC003166]|uniref:acetolactate synthase catalytic subunit n=1 Tax=Tsukamurella sp. NPDC003166 TaxID=3154444 RepID=UPI0033AF3574
MTAPDTVADVLAARLKAHGVDLFFGQSLPSRLVLAAEDAGIRQIVYRTENAGGAMADGYARLRRTCGFVVAQNGPAATLLVAPLTEALHASIPIVALVQEVPSTSRGRNAFQEIDHRALFSGCSTWFGVLDDGDRAEEALDAAIRSATTGRPGPAVLMLPKDVLERPGTAGRAAPVTAAHSPRDRPRPDADAIARAWDALRTAERPLIVAGGGVVSADASAALVAFSSETGIAVATTPMGKGAIPDDDPLALGVIGNYMGPHSMTHRIRDWIGTADVVLLAGSRTNENGTDSWTLLPHDAAYLHLDIDPFEVGRNYPAHTRLIGDVRAGLTDLLAHARAQGSGIDPTVRDEAVRTVAANRSDFIGTVRRYAADDAVPLRPETIVTTIDALSPADAVFAADASYSSIWIGTFVSMPDTDRRTVLPRGIAGLGWGLPLALGAKAADPARTVVCLTGDGGFAHCWSELETAVREELPVIVVVLNNAELGYQKHAEIVQFGRATSAVVLGAVDHAAIARACGARGSTVRTRAAFVDAFTAALSSPVPVVIDVITDPDAYPPITGWDTSTALRTALSAPRTQPDEPEYPS